MLLPSSILSVCYCAPKSNRKVLGGEKAKITETRWERFLSSSSSVWWKWQRPFKEIAHKPHIKWRKQKEKEKESRDSRMNASLRFTMRKSNFHFFLIGKCHDSVLPSIRYNLHCCKQKKLLCSFSLTHKHEYRFIRMHSFFLHISRSNERALRCNASIQMHALNVPSRLKNMQPKCVRIASFTCSQIK